MAGIDVKNLSPELAKLVVKNNQVDTQKLQEIANSKTMKPELVAEANKLIAQELTGNKAWGDIGDKFPSGSTSEGEKPVKEYKYRDDKTLEEMKEHWIDGTVKISKYDNAGRLMMEITENTDGTDKITQYNEQGEVTKERVLLSRMDLTNLTLEGIKQFGLNMICDENGNVSVAKCIEVAVGIVGIGLACAYITPVVAGGLGAAGVGGGTLAGAATTKALASGLVGTAALAPLVKNASDNIVAGQLAYNNAKTKEEAEDAILQKGEGIGELASVPVVGAIIKGTGKFAGRAGKIFKGYKSEAKTVKIAEPSEIKPENKVKTSERKQEPIKNKGSNLTSEQNLYNAQNIESHYTDKSRFTVERGYQRTITGEPGFETETYTNPKPGEFSWSTEQRYSKAEFKYQDGRRVQETLFTEYGEPSCVRIYRYDSRGRLVEVLISTKYNEGQHAFDDFRVEHSFKYNENNQLVEHLDSGLRTSYIYEYDSNGTFVQETTSRLTETPEPMSEVMQEVKAEAKPVENVIEIKDEPVRAEAAATRAAERKAILDDAGFTEEVVAKIEEETRGSYSQLVPSTLKMVEYLQRRIYNGETITPKMIEEAIVACDDIYAQPGYGSKFQEMQKGILAKYWKHADMVRDAYRSEDRFFTQAEAAATRAAERKAILDDAGFTEEVIAKMEQETMGSYGQLVPNILKMVEYMQRRIYNGEKITPKMIDDAIAACDDIYAQPGYGSKFQEMQKSLLAKYWKHSGEVRDAYQ